MNFFKKNALVLKISVTLFFVALTAFFLDIGRLMHTISSMHWSAFVIAVLISSLSNVFGTFSWYFLVRSRLQKIRLLDAFTPYWIGLFFNNVLPTNIGGDIVKGYSAVRRLGHRDFVIASIMTDRLLNFLILALIGAFAALWVFVNVNAAVISAAAAFFLLLSLRLWIDTAAKPSVKLLRAMPRTIITRVLVWSLFQLRRLARRGLWWPATLLAAFGSQFFKIWFYFYLLAGMGLAFGMMHIYFIIPVLGFVSALPISIGGLGIREASSQFMATALSFNEADLVALTFAGYLVFLVSNALGAVFFIFDRGKEDKEKSGTP